MCEAGRPGSPAREANGARWHRRAEERRDQGHVSQLRQTRDPLRDRTRCESCARKRREADVERHRRRTEARIAEGLCPEVRQDRTRARV